jgi:hypothetical protein
VHWMFTHTLWLKQFESGMKPLRKMVLLKRFEVVLRQLQCEWLNSFNALKRLQNGLKPRSQLCSAQIQIKPEHFQPCINYTPLAVVFRTRKTPPQRINHCYDSANSGCFVERGCCDRCCTQHAKIPSGSSLTSRHI